MKTSFTVPNGDLIYSAELVTSPGYIALVNGNYRVWRLHQHSIGGNSRYSTAITGNDLPITFVPVSP